jgi:hypothetical protein
MDDSTWSPLAVIGAAVGATAGGWMTTGHADIMCLVVVHGTNASAGRAREPSSGAQPFPSDGRGRVAGSARAPIEPHAAEVP